MTKEQIRLQILLPLAMVLLLLLSTYLFAFQWNQRVDLEEELNIDLNNLQGFFNDELYDDIIVFNGILDFIEADKDLQQAFLEKDKEKLLKYALPIYEEKLAKYRISHFYFIEKDGNCFLRVHHPKRDGDIITRETFKDAKLYSKPSAGIELGPLGHFALRVVHPWRVKDKLIGYLELGEEIGHIAPSLSKAMNIELIFTINKKFVDKKRWEEGLKVINSPRTWNEYKNFVITDHTTKDIHKPLKEAISKLEHSDKKYVDFSYQNNLLRLSSIPLKNYNGTIVGKILALKDITLKQEAFKQMTMVLIAIGIIVSFILFIFFYVYLGQIEKELLIVYNNLEKAVQERTRELNNSLLKLESINIKLKEANNHKDKFLSTMSHELRTPLNAVLGFSQALEKEYFGKLNEKQKEYVNLIYNSAKHLLSLINDILHISVINAGSIDFDVEEFPVDYYVNEIISLMDGQFKDKQISFNYSVPSGLGLIKADKRKCKQVLINILSNALKFTASGGTVELDVSKNTNKVKIQVTDTGMGISIEDRDKIFSEFYQSDYVKKQVKGGAGIGLALAKKYIELHECEIGFESEQEKGSIFWFTLPLSDKS